MTLDEAYEITYEMTCLDHKTSTDIQREAKEVIYQQVIKKNYLEVPPHLEPDFNEGWK